MKRFFGEVVKENWVNILIMVQMISEGFALANLHNYRSGTREPLLRSILEYVIRDEARHVAFGHLYVRQAIAQLHPDDREAVAENAFRRTVEARDWFGPKAFLDVEPAFAAVGLSIDDVAVEFPRAHGSFVDLLRARAQHQPERRAFTYLADGDETEELLSYAELETRARAIGALLQSVAARGERVVLLYPPGLDFIVAFLGCLYAGAIAVPAYPPAPARLQRMLPRLEAVVKDAGAAVVLTTSPILTMAEAIFGVAPGLQAAKWLATDETIL